MAHVGLLEDNARIARLSATMLQFTGHIVTIYEQGRDLLDALHMQRTTSEFASSSCSILPIEVLILDLQLPDITGIEVVKRLQSFPHTRTLPLIFCTAACSIEIEHALGVAPHAKVVEKPFKLQALTDAVISVLELQSVGKI